MKILGTGLSGLLGSRVVELLSGEHEFINLSRETGFDITAPGVLLQAVTGTDAPWVLHFAAFTDVDRAEADRVNGQAGEVWRLNVGSTAELVRICELTGRRLLYVSTDFVFDGQSGPYTETSEPRPLSWYAVTKYEGEKLTASLGEHGLIIRLAFPYRRMVVGVRPDFVRKISESLTAGREVLAPDDQLITPTFVDDVVRGIAALVRHSASGVYHLVGDDFWSPYEVAKAIAKTNGLNPELVVRTSFADFYKDRAPRPFQVALKHDRISELGVKMCGFAAGLAQLQK